VTEDSHLVVCTGVGAVRGAETAAAALAVGVAVRELGDAGTLLLDLRAAARNPRGTLLASGSARALESVCGAANTLRGAARGRVCFAVAKEGNDGMRDAAIEQALDPGFGAALVVCLCDPAEFRHCLARRVGARRSALLRAAPGVERPLLALTCRELLSERIPVKAWTAPIGPIPARRALAGLEPGGESGRRAARFAERLVPARRSRLKGGWSAPLRAEGAQALPAVLGISVLVVALALILTALGGAAGAKGRLQRAADLAALSAARSMRDDLPRLFLPPLLANGSPNPAHIGKDEYLDQARIAGADAAERNGMNPELVAVSFPDGGSFAPLRVRVAANGEFEVSGNAGTEGASTSVKAKAEIAPPTIPDPAGGTPTMASGGGYAGPLAYRQGKPMP